MIVSNEVPSPTKNSVLPIVDDVPFKNSKNRMGKSKKHHQRDYLVRAHDPRIKSAFKKIRGQFMDIIKIIANLMFFLMIYQFQIYKEDP